MTPQGDEPQARPADTDALIEETRRRWSTAHDRGAHDYTDAGCRVLAEHGFRDVNALADALAREREAREATEAACQDYEAWLDDALEALGVKTVFDIKDAKQRAERAEARVGRRLEAILRLLAETRISDPAEGCWEWVGARSPQGYGYLTVHKESWTTHRLSFSVFVRPLEPGEWVLHRCDNPPCIRPDHIYAGTHADNTRDAVERGRMAKGADHGQSKLDDEKVALIRRRRGEGALEREIAAELDVDQTTVSRILHGKDWSHLDSDDVDLQNDLAVLALLAERGPSTARELGLAPPAPALVRLKERGMADCDEGWRRGAPSTWCITEAGREAISATPSGDLERCPACSSTDRPALWWSKAGFTYRLCDTHKEEAREARRQARRSASLPPQEKTPSP